MNISKIIRTAPVAASMPNSNQSNLCVTIQPAFTRSKLTIETLTTRYDIRSDLAIKTPERRQWVLSGVFIVNFKHILNLVLVVFLLLTLSR